MTKKPVRKRTALHRAPATKVRAVWRGVHQVLARHGIAGRVKLLGMTSGAVGDGPAPIPTPRMVCHKLPTGQIVCSLK